MTVYTRVHQSTGLDRMDKSAVPVEEVWPACWCGGGKWYRTPDGVLRMTPHILSKHAFPKMWHDDEEPA